MKRSNDQISRITLFHIGDKVLLRRDYAKNSFSTKLDDKWNGPYYIEEPIGPTTYYLHDGLKKLKNPAHASRMKSYYPRNHQNYEVFERKLVALIAEKHNSPTQVFPSEI